MVPEPTESPSHDRPAEASHRPYRAAAYAVRPSLRAHATPVPDHRGRAWGCSPGPARTVGQDVELLYDQSPGQLLG